MVVARWNEVPRAATDAVGPSQPVKHPLREAFIWAASGLFSALTPQYCAFLLSSLRVRHSRIVAGVVCYSIAVLAFTIMSRILYKWRWLTASAKRQAQFSPTQRSLLGFRLPVAPAASQAGALTPIPKAMPPLPSASTPITPPLNVQWRGSMRSPWSEPTPKGQLDGLGAGPPRTPQTPSSTISQRLTPGYRTGSPPIATQQQLEPYLQRFAMDTLSPQTPSDAWNTYDQSSFSAYDHSMGGQGSAQQQLPPGRTVIYRPSWLPKKVSSAAVSDMLQPSSEEEMEEILTALLYCSRRELDVWTERLREWFAHMVLKPLAALTRNAQDPINELLGRYGDPLRLPSLLEALGSGSPMAASGQPDIDAMLAHVEGRAAQIRVQLPNESNQLQQGAHRYRQLMAVLRGKRPADLLPPAPVGYLTARIQQLAEGSCVSAFRWAGGGSWEGKPWSPELPNDSALLLYLFAAFISAPSWTFAQWSGGMPLYLGSLPARPPRQYTAVLAYRPDKPGPEVDVVVASALASAKPMFSLLLEGRTVTLCSYVAVFHTILMLLQYHKQKYGGLLGQHALGDELLQLNAVIAPVPPPRSLPQRVFGWWFPPLKED